MVMKRMSLFVGITVKYTGVIGINISNLLSNGSGKILYRCLKLFCEFEVVSKGKLS